MELEFVDTVRTVIKDSYLDNHRKELVDAITYILTEPGEVYTFSKVTSTNHIPKKVKVRSEDLTGTELNLMIGVVLHEMELRKMYFYNITLDYKPLTTFIRTTLKSLEENDRS